MSLPETTEKADEKRRSLPFNRGHAGDGGNPHS